MTDAKSAWNDTGEQLTALGSKLGAHFEAQRGAEGESAREQTQEAFKRLGEAVKDTFDAVGAAARDDAVKQDVKQVGRSLVGALDVTFRELSDEVRKAFDRNQGDAPADPKPTAAPTAADTTTSTDATEAPVSPPPPTVPREHDDPPTL